MGPGVTSEIDAILRLKMSPGFGDRRINALVEELGSGVAAMKAIRAQGQLFEPPDGAAPVPTWERRGLQAVPITGAAYPAALRDLPDPPPLLFLKGREVVLRGPAVAIVGARRATEGGRAVAEALGRKLGAAGITVVSGMALGIDGAAHRGALSVRGNSVAVLGSGLNVVYPPGHRGLFRDLGANGLLLSEFLPWEAALPHHFPKRNRIIAALARAIIVVEAGERSGALITVDHGLDLGRDILAVPGSLQNPRARGTNALIRDGARPIVDPETVLDEFPLLLEEAAAIREADSRGGDAELDPAPSPPRGPIEVPSDLQAFWVILRPEPQGVDAIAEGLGLSPGEVLAGMSALELMGRAHRCPGMRFRRG